MRCSDPLSLRAIPSVVTSGSPVGDLGRENTHEAARCRFDGNESCSSSCVAPTSPICRMRCLALRRTFVLSATAEKALRGASPSYRSREIVMEAHSRLPWQANRFRFNREGNVYPLSGTVDLIRKNGRAEDEIP